MRPSRHKWWQMQLTGASDLHIWCTTDLAEVHTFVNINTAFKGLLKTRCQCVSISTFKLQSWWQKKKRKTKLWNDEQRTKTSCFIWSSLTIITRISTYCIIITPFLLNPSNMSGMLPKPHKCCLCCTSTSPWEAGTEIFGFQGKQRAQSVSLQTMVPIASETFKA